jgi:hypothetical protein
MNARSLFLAGCMFVLGATGCAQIGTAAPSGAQSAPQPVSFAYFFAGYNWSGATREISGSWHVPRITQKSAVGHALTWIGAQAAAGGAPFIQLGTTEDDAGGGQDSYEVFWSDTTASFHPQTLGVTHPGDLVSAEMTLTQRGWRLSVVDEATHRTFDTTVDYGGGVVPDQAEWLQENPSIGDNPPVELPYPVMTDTDFTALEVDGHPPKLALSDGQVLFGMTGTILVPSPVRHDAFTVGPPTGLARQYLVAARNLDSSQAQFTNSLNEWNQLSPDDRLSAAQADAAALAECATAIGGLSAPAKDRSDLSALTQHFDVVHQDYLAWISSGLSLTGTAFAKLSADARTNPQYSDAVRVDLGLPPAG